MRIVERRIPYTYGDKFILYGLFDIHLGSRRCREDKLAKVISEIASNPNALWLLGGDSGEMINRSDPRHKESELADWLYGKDDIVRAQVDKITECLNPIASKCIAVLCGNHEGMILKHYERNVYSDILTDIKDAGNITTQIGVGYGGFVRLKFDRGNHTSTLMLFAQHGYGGGRKQGGNILNTGDSLGNYDCDIFWTGHRHRCHLHTKSVAVARGMKIVNVTKLGIMSGAFRDSTMGHDENDAGGYEDMAGYGASDMSGVRVTFVPDENRVEGTIFQY